MNNTSDRIVRLGTLLNLNHDDPNNEPEQCQEKNFIGKPDGIAYLVIRFKLKE